MAIDPKTLNGRVVSFQLYPASIITDDFTMVRVVGVTTHDGAGAFISPSRNHTMVYATLPPETPNDYRQYDYLLIQLHTGKITAVGIPWINQATMKVVGSTELRVTIRGANNEDINRLSRVLMENNFTDFDIELVGK